MCVIVVTKYMLTSGYHSGHIDAVTDSHADAKNSEIKLFRQLSKPEQDRLIL
jgi:hypothetical protein